MVSPNRQRELATALRIDEICDEFEQQWQFSVRPNFDSYLGKIDEAYVDRLLRQLLVVDVELRISDGQSVQSDDYQTVHDDAPGMIEALLESLSEQMIDTEIDTSELVAAKTVGPFRLVEELGQGGMGVVWKAIQTEPIQRTVAVKVIKQGLDSSQLVARFNSERQAQAIMEHPNIVRIIDAGTTELGRPYFAMEFVQGEPLSRYCDNQQLGIRSRLELFNDVCSAVQHAHQKQVIHRDLKPSNILICVIEGKPVPKVIDFGLAKALRGTASKDKVRTQFGQLLGSLQYMSPEQAGWNDSQVDTRSDIYSLGVILFELLTGDTPISKRQVVDQSLPTLLKEIGEDKTIRPSEKFRHAKSRQEIAARRGTTSESLQQHLSGDLDWIVMKALAHDREMRYQSVSELREDIRRFLNDESVLASPPSKKHRLKRFVRKHRKEVIAVSLLLATLIAGIVGTTTGWLSASARAEGERLAREKSQKRLAQVQRSNAIIGSIFNDLRITAVDQSSSELRTILARRLIKAADTIDQDSIGDPLAVAEMQQRLGESLVSLGFARDGIPLIQAALDIQQDELDPNDIDVLMAISDLGYAYNHNEQQEKAVLLLEDTVPRLVALLGADARDAITATKRLAFAYVGSEQPEKALELFEHVLDIELDLAGEDSFDSTSTLISIAGVNLTLGNIPLAQQQYKKSIRLLETSEWSLDPISSFRAYNGLAASYRMSGDFESALPLCQNALEYAEKKFGKDHPKSLRIVDQLAGIHLSLKQFEKVIPLMESSLLAYEERFGEKAVDCVRTRRKLGFAYLSLDDLKNALAQYEVVAKIAGKQSVREEAERYVESITRGLKRKAEFPSKQSSKE